MSQSGDNVHGRPAALMLARPESGCSCEPPVTVIGRIAARTDDRSQGACAMNKSLIIGLVAGIGIATAGGVAAYQFLGRSQQPPQGSATVDTPAQPAAKTPAAARIKAPARRDTAHTATVARTEPRTAPAAQPTSTEAAAANCDHQATTPQDKNQIAGTAAGAAIGGIVGHNFGHHKLTTAIISAAGAYFGNRFEKKYQDDKAQKSAGASGCPPD